MEKKIGREGTKPQKRTFAYACSDVSGTSGSYVENADFRIDSKIQFQFKNINVFKGLKTIEGFYKGDNLDELLNSDYYIIHALKFSDDDYGYNDVLFTQIYDVDYDTKNVSFKVLQLNEDDKKAILFNYFKKIYLEKEIETPYKEFNLDDKLEKEFLFKYFYEALDFKKSEKFGPLISLITDMQFDKIKTYKEIILNKALNMDKMMEDFFKFIKGSKSNQTNTVIYNIYNRRVYDYQRYYPDYFNTNPYENWCYTTTSDIDTVVNGTTTTIDRNLSVSGSIFAGADIGWTTSDLTATSAVTDCLTTANSTSTLTVDGPTPEEMNLVNTTYDSLKLLLDD